jgi:hypothetical protein
MQNAIAECLVAFDAAENEALNRIKSVFVLFAMLNLLHCAMFETPPVSQRLASQDGKVSRRTLRVSGGKKQVDKAADF